MSYIVIGAALKIGAVLGELIVLAAFLYLFYCAYTRR